jgi:hypothetical protein
MTLRDEHGNLTKTYEIVRNGERVNFSIQNVNFLTPKLFFVHENGESLIKSGKTCPIKAVFAFKDGNKVHIRGDRYDGRVHVMVANFKRLIANYSKQKVLLSCKIYENLGLLNELTFGIEPLTNSSLAYYYDTTLQGRPQLQLNLLNIYLDEACK